MPRNSAKQRCAYPGCRAWAMRGSTLCAAHAGRTRRPELLGGVAAAAQAASEEMRITTLEEEIALLASRRDMVDRLLKERVSGEECDTAEALRYLTVLAQVGKSLAGMLVQRAATSGADELERFFEAVARRVHELQPRDREH